MLPGPLEFALYQIKRQGCWIRSYREEVAPIAAGGSRPPTKLQILYPLSGKEENRSCRDVLRAAPSSRWDRLCSTAAPNTGTPTLTSGAELSCYQSDLQLHLQWYWSNPAFPTVGAYVSC